MLVLCLWGRNVVCEYTLAEVVKTGEGTFSARGNGQESMGLLIAAKGRDSKFVTVLDCKLGSEKLPLDLTELREKVRKLTDWADEKYVLLVSLKETFGARGATALLA